MKPNEGDYFINTPTNTFYIFKNNKWTKLVTMLVPEDIEEIIKNIITNYYTNLQK